MTAESIGKRESEGKKVSKDPMSEVTGTLRGYNNEFESEKNLTIKKNLLKSIASQLTRLTQDNNILGEILEEEKKIDSSNNLENIKVKLSEIEIKIFAKIKK